MSLFVFNPFRASEELTPPQLRGDKMTAWLRVLLRPVKYLSDLFTSDFIDGTNAPDYDVSTTYLLGSRVVWEDRGVYELRVATSTGVNPTGDTLSSTNWRKILNDFIGIDETFKTNGQLIVAEYTINRYFKITAAPYIYFGSITPSVPQTVTNVYIPVTKIGNLGTNLTAQYSSLRRFTDKYLLGNTTVNIITY